MDDNRPALTLIDLDRIADGAKHMFVTQDEVQQLVTALRAAWQAHEHDRQSIRDLTIKFLQIESRIREIDESRTLAEKNCAAAELALSRYVDLSAQLAVLYPQAGAESDTPFQDSLRGMARWFTAHVPADIARLRRHSQALAAILHRDLEAMTRATNDRARNYVATVLAEHLRALEPGMLDDFASLTLDDWPPKP